MRRWIAAAALAVVLALAIACCGKRDHDDDLEELDAFIEETRDILEELQIQAKNLVIHEPAEAEVAFGESVQMGNLVLTMEEPRKDWRQWVAMLTCTNVGTEPEVVLPAEFVAVDAEEKVFFGSFWDFDSTAPEFEWTDIPPGATRRGCVGFYVPHEDMAPASVIWEAALDPFRVTWRKK